MFKIASKIFSWGILGFVIFLIFWTLSALFWGWILMIGLGIFNVEWAYEKCFLIGYLIALVLG